MGGSSCTAALTEVVPRRSGRVRGTGLPLRANFSPSEEVNKNWPLPFWWKKEKKERKKRQTSEEPTESWRKLKLRGRHCNKMKLKPSSSFPAYSGKLGNILRQKINAPHSGRLEGHLLAQLVFRYLWQTFKASNLNHPACSAGAFEVSPPAKLGYSSLRFLPGYGTKSEFI